MAERIGTEGVHLADASGPPDMRLYAIGDVHGRFDLLQDMHARIRDEIERDAPADWRLIHIGDYIDRGPQSREVVDRLVSLSAEPRVVSLLGNHDAGLLDFLARPEKESLFARHGGQQTAASYGVEADFSSESLAREAAAALRSAIPPAHLTFLATLPRSITFGDFFFCHAGIRPGVRLEDQNPEDLIWIRKVFLESPLLHPKVVVHGHTPTRVPDILPNRVNVDTGAWYSGVLSALAVEGTTKRLLQVSA